MKYTIILCLTLISILVGCKSHAQLSEVKGIVSMVYSKDTLNYEKYWLVEKTFQGLHFEEDLGSLIGRIDLVCEDFQLEKLPEKTISFYSISQFQKQSEDKRDFYKHYGGDVYINNKNEKVITFNLFARVIKLEKPPCANFSLLNAYSCPVEKAKVKYPIYIIVDVIEARSLENETQKERNLEEFLGNSFSIGYCN